jgi:hypothetical protein
VKKKEPKFASTAKSIPELKRFYLERVEDVSGTSGTGIVAAGVVYPSGAAVIEWTTVVKSISIYHSVAELDAIHSHEGRTVVRWVKED